MEETYGRDRSGGRCPECREPQAVEWIILVSEILLSLVLTFTGQYFWLCLEWVPYVLAEASYFVNGKACLCVSFAGLGAVFL